MESTKKKKKNKKLFSFKKKSKESLSKDEQKNDGLDLIKEIQKKRLESSSSEASVEVFSPLSSSREPSLGEHEEEFVTTVSVINEDEGNLEDKNQDHQTTIESNYKLFDKALEIPLISDGFGWVSNMTEPYIDKAKCVSTPLLDQLAPYVEDGKNKLNQIEYSRTMQKKLMDFTDNVDERAANYLEYLLDYYPVVKTPTWDLVKQITVNKYNKQEGNLQSQAWID